MKVQKIQFKGQEVCVGDVVTAKLVQTHVWAEDFDNQISTIVVEGIDDSVVIGGMTQNSTIDGWRAYVALADDGDSRFECTLISVTKPTTKE